MGKVPLQKLFRSRDVVGVAVSKLGRIFLNWAPTEECIVSNVFDR
jgi:hypothetical protein